MAKKVCVVGLGHIGLPTAAFLSTHGYHVVGVDIDASKIDALRNGESYLEEEPGLTELVREALKSQRFRPSLSIEPADAFIISVPTPLRQKSRKADLRHAVHASKAISKVLKRKNLVILESTVPPRTTEALLVPMLERSGLRAKRDFYVAHCPERAVPGRTLHEVVHNDRVIGGLDPTSAMKAQQLYSSFVKGAIHLTDATTAEMVKLMENTARDVNIAIANEFALLATEYGVDVWKAIELANHHPRVKILRPGPGVGGHCIAIDPWFLAQRSRNARLIRVARSVNKQMPDIIAAIARDVLKGIRRPAVVILGVAYKGNVTDTRESPAAVLSARLPSHWDVRFHDPRATDFVKALLPLEAAAQGSDCLILMADHDEYLYLDPKWLAGVMRRRILIDTRNHLDRMSWEKAGYNILTLGRPRKQR